MFHTYEKTNYFGKRLWQDLVNAFRGHTAMERSKPMATEYIYLIVHRGIQVNEHRNRNRHEAVIRMLQQHKFILSLITSEPNFSGGKPRVRYEDARIKGLETSGQHVAHKNDRNQHPANNEARAHEQPTKSNRPAFEESKPGDPYPIYYSSEEEYSDSNSINSGKDADRHNEYCYSGSRSARAERRPDYDEMAQSQSDLSHSETSGTGISPSVSTFMKPLSDSSSKFGGFYDDDLEIIFDHNDSMDKMCGSWEAEKRLAIPIMIKDNSLQYFNSYGQHYRNFDGGALFLRTLYKSSEERSRILSELQTMRLGRLFSQHPEITFSDLNLVIKANFFVLKEPIPTLRYMKEMLPNRLYISIQKRAITYHGKYKRMSLEMFFLIHRWKGKDMDFVCYTEEKVWRIHNTFGHPPISAMASFLRLASDCQKFDPETSQSLENIREDCRTCRRTY